MYAINYLRNSKCASPVTFSIEVICGSLSKAIVTAKAIFGGHLLEVGRFSFGLLWDLEHTRRQVAATSRGDAVVPQS